MLFDETDDGVESLGVAGGVSGQPLRDGPPNTPGGFVLWELGSTTDPSKHPGNVVEAAIILVMPKMHLDEVDIDEALVRSLLELQFPMWAHLPLVRVEPGGTVNAIFRLGDDLSVRLARRHGRT